MRFEQLHLHAYGRFKDQTLDFGSGAPDFHIIYGPNEAGKTTTLAAISDILFGIEERTPYGFLHGYQQLQLGATISGREGARLSFRRHKKRTNSLSDAQGCLLDETCLTSFLGSKDRTFFTKMFGLDHHTLREGGELIVQEKGDLGQILFQAGVATQNLKELSSRLEEEARGLFISGGQKPTINANLSSYKSTKTSTNRYFLKRSRWTQLLKTLAGDEEALKKIRTEKQQLETERSRLERIRRIRPLLPAYLAAKAKIEELVDVPHLPDDAPTRRKGAEQAKQANLQAISHAEKALARLKANRAELTPNPLLVAQAEEVQRLQLEQGGILKAQVDLVRRRAELTQAEATLAGVLHNLGRPKMVVEEAKAILLPRPKAAAIRALISEATGQSARLLELADAEDKARDKVERLERECLDLPPVPSPERLRETLREATRHGRLDDLLVERTRGLEAEEQALAKRLSALPLWSDNLDALANLVTPSEAAVMEGETRWSEAMQRHTQALIHLTQTQEEEQQREIALRALTDVESIVTEDRIDAARQDRDRHWHVLRRVVAGQEPLPEGTVERYEQALIAADRLADRGRTEAGRRARYEDAVQHHLKAQQAQSKAETALATAVLARENEERAWKMLWGTFTPGEPRVMRGWLGQRREILQQAKLLGKEQDEGKRLCTLMEEQQKNLALLLGEEGTYRALVDRAERCLGQLEQRTLAERDLDAARKEQDMARKRRAAFDEARNEWRERWKIALLPLERTVDTSVVEVEALLDLLGDLDKALGEAEELSRRIRAMEKDAETFKDAVARLMAAVAPDLTGKPALEAMGLLEVRTTQALEAERDARRIQGEIEATEAAHRAATTQLTGSLEALDILCRQAGCMGQPERLEGIENRFLSRAQAEQDKKDLERRILEAGDGFHLEQLQEEAESISPDSLGNAVEEVKNKLHALDDEATTVQARLAQSRAEHKEMLSGESISAEMQQEMAMLSSKITEDAERYIRLRMGSALLSQAIENYRKRFQGPLMNRGSEIFRHLTLGNFSGLDTNLDSDRKLVLRAVRDTQTQVDVDRLSEGSRDQLYLALRLASIELHLDSAWKLPFVADDLLVHFDDDRVVAALEVLAQLAKRTQVLFFTHNWHMVELARKRLAPETYREQNIG